MSMSLNKVRTWTDAWNSCLPISYLPLNHRSKGQAKIQIVRGFLHTLYIHKILDLLPCSCLVIGMVWFGFRFDIYLTLLFKCCKHV